MPMPYSGQSPAGPPSLSMSLWTLVSVGTCLVAQGLDRMGREDQEESKKEKGRELRIRETEGCKWDSFVFNLDEHMTDSVLRGSPSGQAQVLPRRVRYGC